MGIILGGNKPAEDTSKSSLLGSTAANPAPSLSATQAVKQAVEGKSNSSDVPAGDNSTEATQRRLDQSENMKPAEGAYDSTVPRDPSAKDLGLDEPKKNEFQREVDAQMMANVAGAGSSEDDSLVTYTSHPIKNLHLGAYHFENGLLKLTPSQSAAFDKMMKDMPMSEQRNVAKLDVSAVDRIVQDRLSAGSQQFDSSVGREQLAKLQEAFPLVGTKPLDAPQGGTAHVNLSQTDNNVEVPLPPVED